MKIERGASKSTPFLQNSMNTVEQTIKLL